MTEIRPIEPEDWSTFRDIRLAALRDSPTAFALTITEAASRSDDEWQRITRERCASDTTRTWVAESGDGRTQGVVAAFTEPPAPDVQLVSMWVAPQARRGRLATRLIDTVTVWAEAAGASRVSLWVTSDNDAALRLYESAGFTATGDHQPLPSDPCKDEVRLTRLLDPG